MKCYLKQFRLCSAKLKYLHSTWILEQQLVFIWIPTLFWNHYFLFLRPHDCSIRVTAKSEGFWVSGTTLCDISSGCTYLCSFMVGRSLVINKYLQLVKALLTLASICKGNHTPFLPTPTLKEKAVWPHETISILYFPEILQFYIHDKLMRAHVY